MAVLPPVIAIDGPSASGKGTVAQGVARALGYHYLNSGALYRAVAMAAMEAGANLDLESTIVDIALNLKVSFPGDRIELGARDVTDSIGTESVGKVASRVAAMPRVREALMARQRAFRQAPGLVADGRDMGSVVFPDALLKIFLTASLEERAQRRHKQLMEKGLSATMAALLGELRERDKRDSERQSAPLKQAVDAVHIDTTGRSAAEAIAQVLALYKQVPRAP